MSLLPYMWRAWWRKTKQRGECGTECEHGHRDGHRHDHHVRRFFDLSVRHEGLR